MYDHDMTAADIHERLKSLESGSVAVLERLLEDGDPRVARDAAKLLLEFSRGRPKQTVAATEHAVTRIVYESAAWMPESEAPIIPAMSTDPV